MACVRKWRDNWVLDWYDENKKRHIEKIEGGRESAERRLAEVIKGGKKSPKNNQTFKEYAEWWLENCARGTPRPWLTAISSSKPQSRAWRCSGHEQGWAALRTRGTGVVQMRVAHPLLSLG